MTLPCSAFLFVANKLHNLIQSKWSQDDFNREPVHVYNLRLAIKSESNVVTSKDIEKTSCDFYNSIIEPVHYLRNVIGLKTAISCFVFIDLSNFLICYLNLLRRVFTCLSIVNVQSLCHPRSRSSTQTPLDHI